MPNNISPRKDFTRFHGGQGWERKERQILCPDLAEGSFRLCREHRRILEKKHLSITDPRVCGNGSAHSPPEPAPCPAITVLTTPQPGPFWQNDRALLPVFLAGFEFFETSAKDNINVKQTFERLVDVICDKMSESLDTDQAATAAKQSARLKETPPPPQPGCGC